MNLWEDLEDDDWEEDEDEEWEEELLERFSWPVEDWPEEEEDD